jgi:hypothetical protein
VLVTSNAAGQTQHIAPTYRPRSSLLLMYRYWARRSPAPPYAEYVLTSES